MVGSQLAAKKASPVTEFGSMCPLHRQRRQWVWIMSPSFSPLSEATRHPFPPFFSQLTGSGSQRDLCRPHPGPNRCMPLHLCMSPSLFPCSPCHATPLPGLSRSTVGMGALPPLHGTMCPVHGLLQATAGLTGCPNTPLCPTEGSFK